MAYSGSSHYFNRIVQKIFEDIQDTRIKVDAILTEADSMEEVIATFKKILVCCHEKGIKLARHKLEFGREVDFAGTHIGGPEGFRPTTVKIEGIINMSHPTNITELRSFLGAWNQLRMYLPDYQHTVEDMQKLLRKDVPFVWDKKLMDDFERIKEILKSPLDLKLFNKNWDTVLYTDYSSKGVGFALTKKNPENRKEKQLIYCGSLSLSKKQKHYPAIYGENLAIITGLEKCRY